MPRGRGGRRAGKTGQSYQNRTDLNAQPIRVAPGQTYGKAGEQAAAQRVVPLPTQGGTPPPRANPLEAQLAAATPLDAPTARPDEPVTTGIPGGPGAGPEVLHAGGLPMDPLTQLKQVYALYPTEDMRALIEDMTLRGEGIQKIGNSAF